MSDASKMIGKLLDETARRDAIHIAIAPAVAKEHLHPGQAVDADGGMANTHVGIVDPFLTAPVQPGERFYIFLYPNTVTSLRHEWTHPAFGVEPVSPADSKAASEAWLREFCRTADCPEYETVIAAAAGQHVPPIEEYGSTAYENDGEYLFFWGRDAHSEIPPEFWHHVEVVAGVKIPARNRATSFSCSC